MIPLEALLVFYLLGFGKGVLPSPNPKPVPPGVFTYESSSDASWAKKGVIAALESYDDLDNANPEDIILTVRSYLPRTSEDVTKLKDPGDALMKYLEADKESLRDRLHVIEIKP
jgi:hypothetical protein